MRKVLLLVLLIGVVLSTGYAQIGLSKGIIGGLNMATMGGSDVPSGISGVTGYAAGVYLDLDIPGPISFEANALYSVKGAKWTIGSITYTDTYAYVDIPILLKYYFPVPAVSPCVYAGPMYSTLLSAKVKQEGGFLPGERDIKDATASGDVSAVIGVGIGFSSLRVDARYNLGLSSLDKNGTAKMYNRVLSLYVGLTL
ncbi:MAG: porin family protein [Bacteroidota bacterium]